MGEVHYFLGIEVLKFEIGGFAFCQKKYMHELLEKTRMLECNRTSTTKLSRLGGKTFEDRSLYRSVIGTLQYLTYQI